MPKQPPKKLAVIPEQLIGKTEITQQGALFLIGKGPPEDHPLVTQLFDQTQPLAPWPRSKIPVLKLSTDAPPSEWENFRPILQQFQAQATQNQAGNQQDLTGDQDSSWKTVH